MTDEEFIAREWRRIRRTWGVLTLLFLLNAFIAASLVWKSSCL